MTRRSSQLRVPLIALVAATVLACGSVGTTTPPGSPIPTATASATATASPAPDLTPGSSPTPVPGSSAGPDDGFFRTQHGPDGNALQIVLQDLTGLVTGIAPRELGIPPFDEGVANVPGQPNTLSYTWVGGSCDTLTSITLERVAGGIRLTAITKTTGNACDLVGVFRGIEITFSEPVDAASVVIGNR